MHYCFVHLKMNLLQFQHTYFGDEYCSSRENEVNGLEWSTPTIIKQLTWLHHLIWFLFQIAWALNKGVKTEYKQFWDVDLGVSYIPWEKVKVDDLDGFAEGGMIDQETVNTGMVTCLLLLNNWKWYFFSIIPYPLRFFYK